MNRAVAGSNGAKSGSGRTTLYPPPWHRPCGSGAPPRLPAARGAPDPLRV